MTLTNKDIETLKGIFVTKEEFSSFRGEMLGFKTEMAVFQTRMLTFQTDIMRSQDRLMKVFESNRDENLVTIGSDHRRDLMLEDHERRLGKLEKPKSGQ